MRASEGREEGENRGINGKDDASREEIREKQRGVETKKCRERESSNR